LRIHPLEAVNLKIILDKGDIGVGIYR